MAAMCPKLIMDIVVQHAAQSNYETITSCLWYTGAIGHRVL